MAIQLRITNISNGITYEPLVKDDITWETERKGSPGKLTFTVIKDQIINFQEGNLVTLRVDGEDVFCGFVFKKTRDKDHHIKVVAYDQLRYLKNKDAYSYKNMKASEVIKTMANRHNLQLGVIEDTDYVIPERNEDNSTVFDIILTALELTLTNKKTMYVLYDDFGKLTLKSLGNMKTTLLIDEETGENFDYTSSIDDSTYNQIKIQYDNEETGKKETFIAKDSSHINEWGLLQYYDTVKNVENAQAKADALLDLYNAKTRNLKITNAIGHLDVRAGKMVIVMLNLGDVEVGNYFLVEKCKHSFKNDEHFMDLTLRGGKYNISGN